ncbi:MAG: isochorismatase family protein [Patescibacteria group bacterium]|nr:isochorismatase family protein [Patescibacteria group bacterium]
MPDSVVEKFYSQFGLPPSYLEIPITPSLDVPFYQKSGDFPDNYGSIRNNATHGTGYNTWAGWRDLAISSYVSPKEGDIVVGDYEGGRLDKWLRDNGIHTLLYAGFSTNLCVMINPIGLQDMFRRHYRLTILRDCTMATEYDDTYRSRRVTNLTIRYIETYLGASTVIPASR